MTPALRQEALAVDKTVMTTGVEILAKLGHFQGDAATTIGGMVAVMALVAYWILKT